MTADAIAFNSRLPGGKVSATEFTCAAKMMPPIPAVAPEIMKTRMRMRGTLMPARRAASALPPTAYTWRPKVVQRARNVSRIRKTTTMTPASGSPSDVLITFAWLAIATVPNVAIRLSTVPSFLLAPSRATRLSL